MKPLRIATYLLMTLFTHQPSSAEEIENKYQCKFNSGAPEAIFIKSFLNEKNQLDEKERKMSSEIQRSRSLVEINMARDRFLLERKVLVDKFTAPSYLNNWRIPRLSAVADSYGSAPEKLICLKAGQQKGETDAVASISNKQNGWTYILKYTIIIEKDRPYIMPKGRPSNYLKMGMSQNEPDFSINLFEKLE